MAPHRNPPLPPRIQQPKTAGANSKLDKTWGQRQFVHATALQRGDSLREGDKVSYELGQDRKTGKPKAENVIVL
ncbi:cold-shock protein [Agrobacterium rhizogenes]|nr:cold-shock protein [Rhizobium rhizogenes]